MIWLVDISRLVENIQLGTPTGIDRVEMAYAQHFLRLAEREDVRFVVTWPHFTGLLPPEPARAIIEGAATRWSRRSGDDGADTVLADLREMLGRKGAMSGRSVVNLSGSASRRARLAPMADMASVWLRSLSSRLSPRHIAEFRAEGARYLHVSQFRLNRPERFRWLTAAGVTSLFLLHDLIPITHPEYCRAGEAARHAGRVDTMLRHASLIVANSAFTRTSLVRHCEATGRTMPRCDVIPLGVEPVFLSPQAVQPIPAATPYFVVVGTIEPRKNLAFLLQLWHRWTGAGQSAKARLVIVGRRGWENENVVDLLERSSGLAASVIEANSLSDDGMAALLKGAAALLQPSFVEGFGLPIVEALASGVPVIASDIDAFREVGGGFVDYAGPTDGPGWTALLDAFAETGSAVRARRVEALKDYRPTRWAEHTQRAEDLLRSIG